MAVTVIATYGGTNANSYIAITSATSIIQANSLSTDAWDNDGVTRQSRSLIVATSQIDSIRWAGGKYFYNQQLMYPRTPPGVEHPIGILGSVDSASPAFVSLLESDLFQKRMKRRVQIACALQALYLIQLLAEGDRASRHRDMQRRGITNWSKSVGGSISESYSYGKHEVLCPDAWEHLRHYKGTAKVTRGDSQSYEFE